VVGAKQTALEGFVVLTKALYTLTYTNYIYIYIYTHTHTHTQGKYNRALYANINVCRCIHPHWKPRCTLCVRGRATGVAHTWLSALETSYFTTSAIAKTWKRK